MSKHKSCNNHHATELGPYITCHAHEGHEGSHYAFANGGSLIRYWSDTPTDALEEVRKAAERGLKAVKEGSRASGQGRADKRREALYEAERVLDVILAVTKDSRKFTSEGIAELMQEALERGHREGKEREQQSRSAHKRLERSRAQRAAKQETK